MSKSTSSFRLPISDLPESAKALQWPQQAMRERDWKGATERWAIIRKAYPDQVEAWVQCAVAHMELKEMEQAGKLLDRARDRFPSNPEPLTYSAELAMRAGKLDEAGTYLRLARLQFPSVMQSWIKSAQYAELTGNADRALEYNQQARDRWPEHPAPLQQYAELAMRDKSWETALQRWEEVRRRFPKQPAGYLRAAEAARRLNLVQEAKKLTLALQYGRDILDANDSSSGVVSQPAGHTSLRGLAALIWTKAIFNLRSEVQRNYLGYSWWVLDPLLHMVVFYVVFGILLERGGENFTVFLLTGLVPWMWFNKAVANSSGSILGGQRLMLQVGLPATFYPLVSILQTSLKQLPVFVLLIGFLLVQGSQVGLEWLALVPVMLVQLLLVLVCSCAVAAIIPFARDLTYLVPTGLTFLMFLSGIFYDYRMIGEEWQSLFLLNPMAFLLKCYREIFIDGTAPDLQTLMWWGLGCTIACLLLLLAYKRLRYVYPRIVLE